ncbi:RNA polymerase-associated protein CTR9, partial [Phenoliferia sp. Uapishka_3]
MESPPPVNAPLGHATRTFDVPMGNESVVVELDELNNDADFEDPINLILESRPPNLKYFVLVVEEAWHRQKWKLAITSLQNVLDSPPHGGGFPREDRLVLCCLLATYNLALARRAPKMLLPAREDGTKSRSLTHSTNPDHPESMIQDPLAPPLLKEEYWRRAEHRLREAESVDRYDKRLLDAQAALMLARGRVDDAGKLFEQILLKEPTHLMALMGRSRKQARVSFAKRSWRPALKIYQNVLALAPNFLPDPRIGIGLCFWMLGERERAKKAWERSAAVHAESSSNSALLLLALANLNASRDPVHIGGEDGRAAAYKTGMEYVKVAFKKDNTTAAAAGPLATHFLYQANYDAALKLAERAVQYADTRALLAEGHVHVARVLHAQNNDAAMSRYAESIAANPEHVVANLAIAQTLIRVVDFPAATNIFETILRRQPRCIEALVSLASIHTHLAFTYHSIADSSAERQKAKELYEQVLRLFAAGKDPTESNRAISLSARTREISHDPDLFIEIAKLWSDENSLDRSLQAYRQSAQIRREAAVDEDGEETEGSVPAPILNNIGVLEYQKGDLVSAQTRFEAALGEVGHAVSQAGGVISDEVDAVLTAVTYNLGVIYEAIGDPEKAKDAFGQILARHSEYVDAKARLALIAMKSRDMDRAHNLIKEALSSQPYNPEIRALYTYFLSQTAPPKLAQDFTLETLKLNKSNARPDVYSLCASGMLYYSQAREGKDPSKTAVNERAAKFLRSADYYNTALRLDPNCAFAAQGLAISIAEGTIGTGVEVMPTTPALLEPAQRAKNSRDALTILLKVKESILDGSVYVNIGHCHFARDEWERAIESYETASKRFFKGKNVNTLLYLARSWYHKANKDHNYSDLRSALKEAQAALELQPNDLAIIFNIAIIQQKGIEILFDLPPARRTLAEIRLALADCEESQKLFERLANDKNDHPPYSKELPFQRQKYGVSLAKRAVDTIGIQEAYEATEQARVERSRQAREAERERQAEEEARKKAEIDKRAHELAEQRRKMREEAELYAQTKLGLDVESDDEKKKKEKGGKKRKSAKAKKEDGESSDEEDDKPKPKKKKAKAKVEEADSGEQQMDVDSDGEEAVRGKRKAARSGKAFKSTAPADPATQLEHDIDGIISNNDSSATLTDTSPAAIEKAVIAVDFTSAGRAILCVAVSEQRVNPPRTYPSDVRDRKTFILQVANALLAFGAPCHRIEADLQHTSGVLNVVAQFVHSPAVVVVTFGTVTGKCEQGAFESETHYVKVVGGGLDMGKLDGVNRLWLALEAGEVTLKVATEELAAMLVKPPIYSTWQRVFFGGALSMIICPLGFSGWTKVGRLRTPALPDSSGLPSLS